MIVDTPYQWLARAAEIDPGRTCLVDETEALSYGAVLSLVDRRAAEIRAETDAWDILPIRVEVDVGSIIEILATQHAGAVPFPFSGNQPTLPVSAAPDIAVCIETSGSSGDPKIVPLTFSNVQASVAASRSRLGNGADDRWLVCLPLSHVGGLSIIWRTLEIGGIAVVAPFDRMGTSIENLTPTFASMVPTMIHRLAHHNMDALASIGSVLVGGAALGRSLWERCVSAGVRIVPTYGFTEAGSQVATAVRGSGAGSHWNVGKPLDGMDVTIVDDEHGHPQPGRSGTIAVEGPAVFDGYLGEEQRQGRFITSDLGWLDSDGMLHVMGRADDVIITGGENVSLTRVGGVISSVEGVDDVCVVGIQDDEWGTVSGAMVVSDLPLESFDAMVRRYLRTHERPKRWLARAAIPTLGNGKHDLVAVRLEFEEELWT